MADETEETLGSEPGEAKPKEPTSKAEAAVAADAVATPVETKADAAGESSQAASADADDGTVGKVDPEPETLSAGSEAETSTLPEAEAALVEGAGAQAAGPEPERAAEEDWERETVFSPAAALPRGVASGPAGATQPKADSGASAFDTRSSGNRFAAVAGVGGRKGGNGLPSGWGAELNKPGLGLLYDVELDATLQFGSKEMLLRDVLELGPGDVVELDSHISEPVDLVVGDRIVARGEVVVASGNFALRVTEVATPQMRLESIRCLF